MWIRQNWVSYTHAGLLFRIDNLRTVAPLGSTKGLNLKEQGQWQDLTVILLGLQIDYITGHFGNLASVRIGSSTTF